MTTGGMNTTGTKSRWLLTGLVIFVVLLVSGTIIYLYRDAPGQLPVLAVSSGNGETVITWQDSRGIHAQRLDSSGGTLWEGVGVVIAGTPMKNYQLVSDGAGGALFAWHDVPEDARSYEPNKLYAQRIGANGDLLWGEGIFIGESLDFPAVVPDGSGGAVFVWNDYLPFHRALHEDILRMRKFSADGVSLWGDEGVLVTASTSYHELTEAEIAAGIKGTWTRSWPTYSGNYAIVEDGAGGVMVIWEEELTMQSEAVYSRRYDNRGEAAWPDKVQVTGSRLFSAEGDGSGGAIIIGEQVVHFNGDGEILASREYGASGELVSDGYGGFFKVTIERFKLPLYVSMEDAGFHLSLQRETVTGAIVWQGLRLVTTGKGESIGNHDCVADGSGGIVVAWRLDRKSTPLRGITAQRIDAGGSLQWDDEGMPVFTGPGIRYQGLTEMLADGMGNTIVIAAVGTGGLNGDTVYAQKLDADGNRLWGNGVRVSP